MGIVIFADLLPLYDPVESDFTALKVRPNWEFWLGTDVLGRDIFSRIIYGSRTSLTVGFFAPVCGMFIGLFLGIVAGYYRGKFESLVVGLMDIILAFPNTYYGNLEPKGSFTNMASVMNEVQMMMDPNADPYAAPAEAEDAEDPGRFGAKDVNDLNWVQLMNAYSCTECGRCTSECPANQTGKLLSPRKIMMDTRDRLEEFGANAKDSDDGKSLLDDYISREELWACTSCNACTQACPINIDPLSIILDMRRYLVMEESAAPTELNMMFTNVENNGAPWQFPAVDRLNWKDEA